MRTFIGENEQVLHDIEWYGGGNRPSTDVIVSEEISKGLIYDIDHITKKIEAPEFLGVKDDHQAERIFFRINRIINNVDLSNLMAIISYKISSGESFIYVVPFFDIYTEGKNMKMLIPWNIKNTATKCAGPIEFSIKFYKTAIETTNNQSVIIYEFNTQIAISQILEGWGSLADITLDHDDTTYVEVDDFYTSLQYIKEIQDGFQLFWVPATNLH